MIFRVMLALAAAAAEAQPIHDLYGTARFHRAYFAAETGEVTFDGFQEPNWEAKARAALPWLNLDRPTARQIARLSSFESAGPRYRFIEFRAPLDPAAGGGAYLLIHEGGAEPIRPVRLKGSVSFDFDAGMTAVERRTASGVIVGETARPVKGAAFAITGKAGDVREIRPGVRFEKKKGAVYVFADGGRAAQWSVAAGEQPDAASAMSFRLDGGQFLLVRWRSDFCGSSYTLFAVEAVLKPVAGNDSDCDP